MTDVRLHHKTGYAQTMATRAAVLVVHSTSIRQTTVLVVRVHKDESSEREPYYLAIARNGKCIQEHENANNQ